jgi:hypothetical protein
MKTFISLTWAGGIGDREATVLIHTVAETLAVAGERLGPWLQSQVLPPIRAFGDWVILEMPRGSAYSSVDWYLERCRTAEGGRIDGVAYLRLVELEPWQASTPHFDLALVDDDLADEKGRSVLNLALPGLAAVASLYQVRQLGSQEAQLLGLRHLVAHALGRATGVPLPARSGDVTSRGGDLYCTNLCVMRPCIELRHLLEYAMEGANQPRLYCDSCQHDLKAILVGSHYGLN